MHTERVFRFRVLRHEELPEGHKEALRERGIDPDERWSLIASSPTEDGAEALMADMKEHDRQICAELGIPQRDTFKVVDGGQEGTLTSRLPF
mgnify:CR=1 FL=1